ncbi:aminopeptidase N [Rothia sp. ZJ1223]|uniref:aminopeptidase N n=1 Tax=Rothia sp. ZJ1223 TaxID=2811098 RepID=UPI00195A6F00|nr:aminopeptidase N [Rothia sp. ZJ1223]MBM7050871.1 aminopeptidase N [Rothia sp. ZJ1223]
MPGMNLTREEAIARAEVIKNVASYKVELDLTRGERVFGSRTEVRFTAQAGASTFIDAITDSVRSIELNGKALDVSLADGVCIELPSLADENVLVIDADMLYTNTGEGLHRFVDPVDGEVYLYSQFEVPDSRRVYPVFEQPDLKAEFEFIVTAPAHWVVVSNQPETSVEEKDEAKVWFFKPTPRISSYITAIIAGPYASTRSSLTNSEGREVPLGVFARKSLMPYLDADDIFELTAQGFEFFEEQFKTPYPFEKYDQLFVPEFNAGAMENAGAVTFLENYIFRSKTTEAMIERRAITVLHELAHMWFGDLVTMKWWNDLWLNESFAEFMSTLAAAENTRFASEAWATFSASEKTWAYRQDQLSSTHPIVAEINDLHDVQVNFDGITYAKGASVLRQLVAWVGQENFMAALKVYFDKHAWGNTVLDDLLDELETTSGRDVRAWSAKWLETAGVNTLTAELEQDENDYITSLTIRQSYAEGYETLRPHRMVVGFYNYDGVSLTRTERFEIDVDGETTEVSEATGKPRPDLVLLNDEDLTFAKLRLDEDSQQTAISHLKDLDSSVARGVLWGALWDATRDGDFPARRYIDLVLNNLGKETNSTAVMVQLRNFELALRSYINPESADETRERAAEAMWEITLKAEPGSDNQLQFLRSFARLTRTEEQLDRVKALLEGEETLAEREIDTDLRWVLVTSLAAGGRLTPADIDAEREADNTSNGQQAAATASAAIPTAEAKAKVWQQVVETGELSNVVQRSAIAGFYQGNDDALFEQYTDKYFETIESLWRERSHEISTQIITGMYPGALPSQQLLTRTEEFLNSLGDDAAGLKRQIAENRDGVVRALKVQAADTL